MEYCKFDICPHHGCENHPRNMPEGEKVTEEGLEFMRKDCFFFQELETEDKIRNMTYGQAFAILLDLENEKTPKKMKGAAIRKVILNMETHNAVKKDLMVEVIRYLFGLCFKEPEG